MAYEVHLDVFDGPFDLLLQLISAQELDVYTVRLADIVSAFCAEVARMEELDLEIATEFLLIASTLVELKCRRLLPDTEDADLDEELALFEARDYLLARLVECKTFTGAASAFATAELTASLSVPRRVGPDESFEGLSPDLLANVSAERLRDIARRALAERPAPKVSDTHVHEDEVTVAEMLAVFIDEIPRRAPLNFRALTATLPSTAHVVASFLAILELYKRELIALDQFTSFGELMIRWIGGAVANVDRAAIDSYGTTSVDVLR